MLLSCAGGIASDEARQGSGNFDSYSDHEIGLSITRNESRLTIQGYVSSTAHEALLRQTAARHYPEADLEFDVERHSPMQPGWPLVTDTILRALADTHLSSARIDQQNIRIRGIITNPTAWSASVDKIEQALTNDMQLRLDVLPIDKSAQFDRLCENLLVEASRNGRVEFVKSSAALDSNALGSLDEIVEIATDCPSLTISVTGHTDNTGNELANVELSKARAESVVNYLVERGIEQRRLTANGVGSASPIASNANAVGRRLNRRIAFEPELRP
jgi:outer membrane protein OmpA-like peptidoglycan-associated protein